MNCAELFQAWLEYRSNFVCERTIEHYRAILPVLKNVFGDRPVESIKKPDVGLLLKAFNESKVKPLTIKRKLIGVNAAWNWALDCELVTKNPWQGVPALIKCSANDPPKPFTKDEIRKIVDSFQNHPRYFKMLPFVRFLFATGVRTGEAIGLRWGDISPDCKVATIRTQVVRKGKRKSTKTGKIRQLILPEGMREMLLAMKRGQDDTPVFTYRGKMIDAGQFLQRPWRGVLKIAGVPYRKPYNTRHTFISHCLESGVNPATVAEICGNSPRVIFMHYAGSLNPPEIPEINV